MGVLQDELSCFVLFFLCWRLTCSAKRGWKIFKISWGNKFCCLKPVLCNCR